MELNGDLGKLGGIESKPEEKSVRRWVHRDLEVFEDGDGGGDCSFMVGRWLGSGRAEGT